MNISQKFKRTLHGLASVSLVVTSSYFCCSAQAQAADGASQKSEAALQLTELGSAAAVPVYGTDNVTAAFEDPGLGFTADYAANPIQSIATGIPTLGAIFSSKWVAAQVGGSLGAGYLSLSPGLGFQIGPIGLRIGAYTNLQFNSFQWNNARLFVNWSFGNHWTIGARTGISVVSNVLDEVTLGVGKSWSWFQSAVDFQIDGSLGTLRLIPGVGVRFGFFEAAVSGSVARASNWTFYADRLKTTVALRIARLAHLRVYYETPYAVDLGLGITL